MTNYKMSEAAKEYLIRIHHYGVQRFGIRQADKYYDSFFDHFELIAKNPYSFESVDHIRIGYFNCPCGSDTIYYKLSQDYVELMAIVGIQDLNNKL